MKNIGKTLVLGLATFALCSCSALETYEEVGWNEFRVKAEDAADSTSSSEWMGKLEKIVYTETIKTEKVNSKNTYEVILDGGLSGEATPGKDTTEAEAASAVLVVALTSLKVVINYGHDQTEEGYKYYLGTLLTKGFKMADDSNEVKWNQYGYTTYSSTTTTAEDETYGAGTQVITISYKS